MSMRNAYRISVHRDNQRLYERLQSALNDLFQGHVEETSYGFYAEDCPEAGAAFQENNPRYVTPSDIRRVLTEPAYKNAPRDEFADHKDRWEDFDAPMRRLTSPLSTIIDSVVHESQNDTTGADEQQTLTL